MESRAFVSCLVIGFSVALFSVFLLSHDIISYPQNSITALHTLPSQVWPDLGWNWRIVMATVIGFLGSAFGTVGGVGGGGIFVPMLTLIVGFDAKSAAALSKCMITGASASSVWYNLRVLHPCRQVPILDYHLALLFQPTLMLGITIGVSLSVVFPYWLITILIIILFVGTSSRSFFKGIGMWKEETQLKKEIAEREPLVNSPGEVLVNQHEPLLPREEKTVMEIMKCNLKWKWIGLLVLVWVSFLLIQLIKNTTEVCGLSYWVLTLLQFPIALVVFGYECVILYKESRKRRDIGNTEPVCEATIQWTAPQLAFCAFCGVLGGTVGGLLGSGGGFILGPLLLEFGVIPQVASATATFVMMFSSSLSVVEFYLLKRFPIPFALYLMGISVLAGFWGQSFVRKLVTFLGRASVIIFILSAVIFFSAITMGVIGIEKSIRMIHNHEFMGFLEFCSSQ